MTTKFKPGDKAKCIDDQNTVGHLEEGRIYTVKGAEKIEGLYDDLVTLEEDTVFGGWFPDRFVLVTDADTTTTEAY